MGQFPTNDSFIATAIAYTPTNTIDPRSAWLFENQTGTLGTNLTGSSVYVGVTGTVRGIVSGTEGVQGTVALLGPIITAGTGYTTGNALVTTVASTVPSSAGTGCTVDIVAVAGVVTSVTLNAIGQQYAAGDVLTVVQGGSTAPCTFRINSVQTLSPLVGDAIDFLGVQAGTILPVVFDYILIPGAAAATNLIVGK